MPPHLFDDKAASSVSTLDKGKWRTECISAVCFYKLWDWPDQFSVVCSWIPFFSSKDYLYSSFQVGLFISGVVERASKELSRRFTSFTSRSRKVSKHEKLEEHSLLTVSNIWNNTSKTNKNTHRQSHTTHRSHASSTFRKQTQTQLLYFLFWKVLRAASEMLTPKMNQNGQQITVRNLLLYDLAFSLF